MLVYCSKCGKEMPEDAAFCPNCGVRTRVGAEKGISIPMDEVREGLSEIGVEIERALREAGREISKAFNEVREGVRDETDGRPLVCPDCGEKNRRSAKYCFKCGKPL